MIKGRALVKEWVEFLKTGNDRAFYALYEHYHVYLTYLGLQRGATTQRIKDHINDLFLYIFEHRETLGHIKHHHNYLVTSFIRNLFRERNTLAYHQELTEEVIPEMFRYPSTEILYIKENAKEEIQTIVREYMAKLSDSQSRLIFQKFYLGLSYQEIAKANEISVKTAYNTVLQAIAKLKKLIPAEYASALAGAITLLSGFLICLLSR